mmetsp:Transcript_10769/g.19963  ORF Transcript_10769/g.19963 Transcript_10769/m.19963 type:complete len:205 (+) Transcript_10769:3821-4435(+)
MGAASSKLRAGAFNGVLANGAELPRPASTAAPSRTGLATPRVLLLVRERVTERGALLAIHAVLVRQALDMRIASSMHWACSINSIIGNLAKHELLAEASASRRARRAAPLSLLALGQRAQEGLALRAALAVLAVPAILVLVAAVLLWALAVNAILLDATPCTDAAETASFCGAGLALPDVAATGLRDILLAFVAGKAIFIDRAI